MLPLHTPPSDHPPHPHQQRGALYTGPAGFWNNLPSETCPLLFDASQHQQTNLTVDIFKLSHLSRIFLLYNILKDKQFAFDFRPLARPAEKALNPLWQLHVFVSSYYYCLCSRLIISASWLWGLNRDYSFYTSCWYLLKTLSDVQRFIVCIQDS